MIRKRWHVLTQLIRDNNYKDIVEVGVRNGRTMSEVLVRCPKLIWYAVDPWEYTEAYPHWDTRVHDRAYNNFKENVAKFPNRVIELYMTSEAAVKAVKNKVDLVFIDGDHRYGGVRQDIDLWLPKIRKKGIISGHDFDNLPRFPGVGEAVRETFEEESIHTGHDHTWWVKV